MVVEVKAVNGDSETNSKSLANGKPIKSKNQLRRLKEKQKKQLVCFIFLSSCWVFWPSIQEREKRGTNATQAEHSGQMEVEAEQSSIVEYVFEQLDLTEVGLEVFSDVFARFQLPPEESLVWILHFALILVSLKFLTV